MYHFTNFRFFGEGTDTHIYTLFHRDTNAYMYMSAHMHTLPMMPLASPLFPLRSSTESGGPCGSSTHRRSKKMGDRPIEWCRVLCPHLCGERMLHCLQNRWAREMLFLEWFLWMFLILFFFLMVIDSFILVDLNTNLQFNYFQDLRTYFQELIGLKCYKRTKLILTSSSFLGSVNYVFFRWNW